MATYNASHYIHEQIYSILEQLSCNDELIISDDCSTDETIELVNSIEDSRIKVIVGIENLGVIKNFERALRSARGDFIFLSDQDDVWLPGKVDECINALLFNQMVITDCIVVDSHLNILYESLFSKIGSKQGFFYNLFKNKYVGCCIAFRKELLFYALPIPSRVAMHDMWLGSVAQLIGGVVFLPKQLLLYRRHDANVTSFKSTNSILKKISFRLILLFSLCFRFVSIFFKKYFKNSAP